MYPTLEPTTTDLVLRLPYIARLAKRIGFCMASHANFQIHKLKGVERPVRHSDLPESWIVGGTSTKSFVMYSDTP
jgi:hypothetical protein